jgi:type I restriction enzyme S subunit
MKRWPTKPLGELSEIVMGQAPPGNESNFDGKGTPFVKAGEFGESRPIIREWTTKPLKFAKSSDVLVCVVGATCGKLNLGADCAIGRSVAAVRPNPSLLNQGFLYAFLQGWTLRLRSGSQGSAQGVITRDMLGSIPMPVPPLTEQERIVKLLDEADELRKLRAQADRRTAEFIPALFHEIFGDANFPDKSLGEIADVVSGVAKGRRFNEQKSVNVPYVRVANVQDGYLDLSELKIIEAFPREIEELSLKRGDVLMTEGGDFNKLGRGAMLEHDLPNCIHQNHVFRVRCNQEMLLPHYFAKFLLTQTARHYFLRCAKKTSNLASINMTQLRALPVPVPPLPLQKEFAQRVMEIRELEASQAASRLRLEELFQSLLHRAFNGEL